MSVNNQVTLIGHIGQIFKQEDSFSKFSLATNDGWGDRKRTNWHNCIVFGHSKKFFDNYCQKGHKIAITGEIEYSDYDDKKYTTIKVNDILSLTNKNSNETVIQEESQANSNEPRPSYKDTKLIEVEDEYIPF